MILPTGKGMFIWKTARLGTPEKVARMVKDFHFDHFCIKIADGTDAWDVGAYVDAIKATGAQVFGWQYIYLYRPIEEAIIAAKQAIALGCDGFIIDAEKQCKNKPVEVATYCHELLDHLPVDYPIGLSSYRYPSMHPELPWKIFRGICDFDMPQVYWEGAHNSGEQLTKSYYEFSAMTPQLPYIPTGSAYRTANWSATPADVEEFMDMATNTLKLPGFNFWEWYCAQTDEPGVWPVIVGHVPEPEPVPVFERVRINTGALNIRSAPVVASNLLGLTYRDKVWTVMGRVKGADGKEWIQIAPQAYIAGWLTKAVV